MTVRIRRGIYAAALILMLIWVVGGSLRLPYLSDDFDHVRLVSEIRAGLRPFRALWTPFHGQTVVLLRLLFWFGTLAGGMSLMLVRVGVLLVHAAGALGCAVLVARWTRSECAGCLAGLLYAGAAGFAGEALYWPSAAIFCFGATFYVLALLALETGRWKPSTRLALSVTALAVSTLGLNAQVAAAAGLAVLPTAGLRRRRVVAAFAAAMIALGGFWWLLRRSHEWSAASVSWRGLLLGGWLVATAPYRFAASWTALPTPGFPTIVAGSVLAWIVLAGSCVLLNREQRRILAALWLPAALLAMVAGAARAALSGTSRCGPGYFYLSARYYYPFLLPLAVHAGFLLSRVPRRWRAAAVLAVAAAVAGSRARYLRDVPRDQYATIARALDRGRLLAANIRTSSQQLPAPVTLNDGPLPLDGAHLNTVSLAFLIYSEYPRGLDRVRLTAGPVYGADAEYQNAMLEGWPARVANGRMESTRTGSRIDFRDGSMEESLVSGFSWWEKPFRWMGAEAAVRLGRAPGALVVSALAPVDKVGPIAVRVEVDSVPAGAFTIANAGLAAYRVPCPTATSGGSGPALVTLRADRVWHGRDIDPRSLDERDLSIAISAIGFEASTP